MFWWDMLQEVGFGASLYRQGFAHVSLRIVLITKVCLYEILFFYGLSVYNITHENVILKILTRFDVDRYIGCLYAVLLITGLRLQRLLI